MRADTLGEQLLRGAVEHRLGRCRDIREIGVRQALVSIRLGGGRDGLAAFELVDGVGEPARKGPALPRHGDPRRDSRERSACRIDCGVGGDRLLDRLGAGLPLVRKPSGDTIALSGGRDVCLSQIAELTLQVRDDLRRCDGIGQSGLGVRVRCLELLHRLAARARRGILMRGPRCACVRRGEQRRAVRLVEQGFGSLDRYVGDGLRCAGRGMRMLDGAAHRAGLVVCQTSRELAGESVQPTLQQAPHGLRCPFEVGDGGEVLGVGGCCHARERFGIPARGTARGCVFEQLTGWIHRRRRRLGLGELGFEHRQPCRARCGTRSEAAERRLERGDRLVSAGARCVEHGQPAFDVGGIRPDGQVTRDVVDQGSKGRSGGRLLAGAGPGGSRRALDLGRARRGGASAGGGFDGRTKDLRRARTIQPRALRGHSRGLPLEA